jgi:hypothetical protein
MKCSRPEEPERKQYGLLVNRPRCPGCNSTRLKSIGSHRTGPNSRLVYSVCRDCGASIKIIVQ